VRVLHVDTLSAKLSEFMAVVEDVGGYVFQMTTLIFLRWLILQPLALPNSTAGDCDFRPACELHRERARVGFGLDPDDSGSRFRDGHGKSGWKREFCSCSAGVSDHHR